MKRVLFSIGLSILAMPALQAFAYVSGKSLVAEKLIYCPQEITCTKKGDFSSCKYNTGTSQYWGGGFDAGGVGGIVYEGLYKLSWVRSNYHNNTMNTDCDYILSNPKAGDPVNASLMLLVKRGVFLEANYAKGSQWVDAGMNGIRCYSDKSQSCPLNAASGFGVVYDKIDIKKYSITPSLSAINIDGRRVFISYDKATSCWSSKICQIDFDMFSNDTGHVAIGNVIVDMDNKMQIVEIHPNESSGVTIKQMRGLNTIEIKEANDPAVVPSVEIINSTGLDIEVFSDSILASKINARESGSLFSNRMSEDCSNMAGCLVSLKTSDGGIVGSVVIDVENQMTVLSARATRPSAIAINIVDTHKIEISYPKKK